jgi:predicted transcriptional regulator
MNYKLFKQEFESSGLTQKGFGKGKSMSPSMLSYYLSKARESENQKSTFSKIEVIKKSVDVIKIRTAQGVEIEIPI